MTWLLYPASYFSAGGGRHPRGCYPDRNRGRILFYKDLLHQEFIRILNIVKRGTFGFLFFACSAVAHVQPHVGSARGAAAPAFRRPAALIHGQSTVRGLGRFPAQAAGLCPKTGIAKNFAGSRKALKVFFPGVAAERPAVSHDEVDLELSGSAAGFAFPAQYFAGLALDLFPNTPAPDPWMHGLVLADSFLIRKKILNGGEGGSRTHKPFKGRHFSKVVTYQLAYFSD